MTRRVPDDPQDVSSEVGGGSTRALKALAATGRVSAQKRAHERIPLPCVECWEDAGRTGHEAARLWRC